MGRDGTIRMLQRQPLENTVSLRRWYFFICCEFQVSINSFTPPEATADLDSAELAADRNDWPPVSAIPCGVHWGSAPPRWPSQRNASVTFVTLVTL